MAFIFHVFVLFSLWTDALCTVYYPNSPPYVSVHGDKFQPDQILRVTSTIINTDCTTRLSTVVNGTMPGPTLRFKEGQKVWIRVYNDMDDANLTIHWHGLTQRMAPFSDGTPMASQWPIPPQHYFDYEFQLQLGDAGTYFYHSHVGFQAATAAGGLIVEEANGSRPPYQYDEDRIILFQDVYYETDEEIERGLKNEVKLIWPGNPKNVAVNGKSRTMNSTVARPGKGCEMAVIEIEPNKAYRMRFVGGTAYSQIFVAFEEHLSLVLIEVDGKYIMPHSIDHLEISTGQRYSAILYSKSMTELGGKSRFWMQFEIRSADSDDVRGYAILKYSTGADPVDTFSLPVTKPLTLPNETFVDVGWLEDQLQPLKEDLSHPFPTLQEVTRRVYVSVQEVEKKTSMGTMTLYEQSGSPWYEDTPHEPYLVSLYKNTANRFPDYERAVQNGGFDIVTKTFPAKIGEVLEIVWQLRGGSPGGLVFPHPWHAHGDHYYDVGMGSGTYDPEANDARLLARHGRIITRDTSNFYRPDPSSVANPVPGNVYSWRVMRLRVQNPGVWMIHCHVLMHMIQGMQTVWVFGEPKDLTPLPMWLADGYLSYGGSAYGNKTAAARVLHYWHN